MLVIQHPWRIRTRQTLVENSWAWATAMPGDADGSLLQQHPQSGLLKEMEQAIK